MSSSATTRSSGSRPHAAVVIAAAGSGERLTAGEPKALVPLAGRPMVARSLEAAGSVAGVELLVVAAPPDRLDAVEAVCGNVVPAVPVRLVPGGATRRGSIRLALEAVPGTLEVVLCHDAARPFATAELFERVLSALIDAGPGVAGAIPTVPAVDTVKRIDGREVVESLPRETVVLAQTPQAFWTEALLRAHRAAVENGVDATDDAMLVERQGGRILVVPGDAGNFKVTTPEDLERARRLAASVGA